MAQCFSCSATITEATPGRGAECAKCGADLHVCKNCRFFDSGCYNDCAEPNAERVVEKERSNFCDYFALSDRTGPGGSGSSKDPMEELKRLLGDK